MRQLHDKRNLQALHRRNLVRNSFTAGLPLRSMIEKLIEHESDFDYSLDAPEVIPTGSLKVDRTKDGRVVSNGNGYASPELRFRS